MPLFYTDNKVGFTKDEIKLFHASFPCHGMQTDRAYWFEFDPVDGDLIDTDVPEHSDGYAASVLADIAKEFWESQQ